MVHPLIILYPPNTTSFTTNGLGSLGEATSCLIRQEANGEYELEMEYPVFGRRFNDIGHRSIIFAPPSPYTQPQAFRVYKISKPMNGVVTYYAAHISYDLSGIPLEPFEAENCQEVFEGLKSYSMVEHNFTFWTNVVKDGYFWPFEPKSIRSLLGSDEGSILDLYGGDYEFDNFQIKLYDKRGVNRGFKIRYGKNLTELTQEEDSSTMYSGVLPYWADSSTEELIMLPEKVVPTKGEHNFTNVLTLDMSSELEDAPTEEELRTATQKYIDDNDLGIPSSSLEVSFIQLSQTEEYKDYAILERVELFDTVTVEYPELGVSAEMEVCETNYDVLAGRYSSITLGKVKANITTTIADERDVINEEIAANSADLEDSIRRATNWITNGQGYMVAVKDEVGNWKEICSLNTPDINTATSVWRWNNGGFGHSNNGYNGDYRTAITQDGHIVADFIDAGTLTANIIRAGLLKGKVGQNSWNLDTGEFTLTATNTTVDGDQISKYVDDRSKVQAETAASNAVGNQTQEDIFNKLTGGGANQGIYLHDGNLYLNASMLQSGIINADLIKAGTIKGKNGINSWNMETGEFTLSSATNLDDTGTTLGDYIDDTSQTNAEAAAKNAVDSQTQTDIFNKLTNNAQNQGIYLTEAGQLYLNATMLKSGIINADLIQAGTLKDKAGNVTFDLENGKLTMDKGTITAASISGSTITGTSISGGRDIPLEVRKGYVGIGDFEVDDGYGRHIFQSLDEVTGMSTGEATGGELYFWAGYGKSDRGAGTFMVNAQNQVHVNGSLWLNGVNILDIIKEMIPTCPSQCGSDHCDCSDCSDYCDCDSEECRDAPCDCTCDGMVCDGECEGDVCTHDCTGDILCPDCNPDLFPPPCSANCVPDCSCDDDCGEDCDTDCESAVAN